MTIFEGEQQLCSCYEKGQEFQKLAELKDSGLVIYCHRTCTEDIRQNEAVETKDAFILYNKKDVKITNSELTSELDIKNISCPRCRKTLDHVQELIQEVKSIEKKIVMGICDHCRKKAQTIKKQFCTCDDIVSKFMNVKGEQKEDTKKYVKIWLSKMGNLVKDGRTVNKLKQMKYRAHSDLQINRDHSPRQDPKLQQMFYSETHKSDINLNTQMKETGLKEDYLKPSVAFSQHTKPVAISFARKSCESEKSNTTIDDSETTSMKTYTGVKELPRTSLKEEKEGEEIFVDISSMDVKEELKRRHDLSLRQMMRLERDSGVLVSVSKRPHVYEIPKIAPWEQKEPTSEYHVESETNMKTSTKTKYELGSRRTRDLDFPSKRLVKYGTSRTLQKNLRDSYNEQRKADKYYHSDSKKRMDKSEEKNIKKLEQRSVDKFSPKTKKLDTKEAKLKTWYKKVSEPKETGIKRHFSFFFPKVEKKENQVQIFVSSTHLITDIREKFLLQAEKKRQEEYQQKLDRDQKKISRDEIKVQVEERTRQSVEDQKTYEEEQDKLTKYKKYSKKDLQSPANDEKEKQDKVKWDKSKQDTLEKDEDSQKNRNDSEKAKKRTKSKPEQGDRFDELSKKSKKDLKSKPEQRHQIDEILHKTKKDVKGKSELKDKRDDEVIENRKKDLKEKSKPKNKDYLESKDKATDNGSKDLRAKYDQQNIGVKKEQKIQIKEDNDLDAKHRKDIEPLKNQAIKEKEQQLLNEIKVAQSTTLKINDKEKKEISVNEENVVKIKQTKEINTKTEKEEQHKKLQENEEKERLKLLEQMWNEKKLKKAAEKEQQSKDKEATSKTLKSNKIKQNTSHNIVTPSEILKNINKEKKETSVNEEYVVKIKQAKEIKIKTEKEELHEKLQKKEGEEILNLLEQMWNEKKLLMKAAKKEQQSKDNEATSKTLKSNKIKQDTSDDKISPSEILKKINKEKKESKDKTSKVVSEWKKIQAEHLKEKALPTESLKHIVIGEKIYEMKRCFEETKGPPALEAINFYQNLSFDPLEEITPQEEPVQKITKNLLKKNSLNSSSSDVVGDNASQPSTSLTTLERCPLCTACRHGFSKIDAEPGKGFLRYALSDRTFIEKGWTVLPTEKVVRKMNVYRMRPAHPEFDWFEHNKSKRLMTYDAGEKLAEFDDNGRGRLYYRSGRLALDYYDAEETNAQQRFVIYSSGEPDERGRTHPITILATFDYLGNGIVFDHAGKIRLKYNQTEGVVLDRSIGPVSHWKWHTLNDPPVLQQVMIDTQLPQKDPDILKLGSQSGSKKTQTDNEEMLAIEFDNFIKEKNKKLSQKFKPFQIKMKALKINEHFSLRVLDQATVYLIFRDGTTSLKLNIGMILDHKEIVDTETAEVGEVSNSLEQFPARTDSLAGLQRSVAHAQRYERQHAERERRLRRPEACASADQLTAAASPPMRLPLRTVPSGPSSSSGYCCSRKPTNILYYNTRLL